ncbi:MAG: ABC transporter permease [Proteobacteria bacterium]|nr:ABC transporter permease [Pseudomonadota bacterium]MDA1300052.1 ABC transporter permease [Pseudomonadota bacterium]
MLSVTLAYRNILRHRRRTFLTALSMTGGFVLCTFSFSMLEGSWGGAVDIFTLDHTGHVQVHFGDYHRRPKVHKAIDDIEAVEDALKAHRKVEAFAPRVFAPALAYAGEKTAPVSVIGINAEREASTSRILQKVQEGEYFDASPDLDGYFGAMVGVSVARSLNIGVGDEIVLISQGADGSIANDIFVVRATIGSRTSHDRYAVYLPLSVAQSFLTMGTRVHEYALIVSSPRNNEAIAREINAAVQAVNPELTALPWQVLEETFYTTMKADKQSNHFMMVIIVFLVFIGVLNTVLMSILERTREFGVIRALGSRPIQIIKLVFLETMIMATLSIAAGLVLLVPILYWLVGYGFALPETIEVGGVEFGQMKGIVIPSVIIAPALLIYGFAALVSIPPGIRAASITPRSALSSH